ncbi:unnamed protein product [Lactuca saligna]|uniref:Uncharacterized protein n=1 Tax=Lactuca saligna TaxID=75948 RepID=A0AA35ZUT5_LACSI|nr:unnamed protein product [Lactuca saligna]
MFATPYSLSEFCIGFGVIEETENKMKKKGGTGLEHKALVLTVNHISNVLQPLAVAVASVSYKNPGSRSGNTNLPPLESGILDSIEVLVFQPSDYGLHSDEFLSEPIISQVRFAFDLPIDLHLSLSLSPTSLIPTIDGKEKHQQRICLHQAEGNSRVSTQSMVVSILSLIPAILDDLKYRNCRLHGSNGDSNGVSFFNKESMEQFEKQDIAFQLIEHILDKVQIDT